MGEPKLFRIEKMMGLAGPAVQANGAALLAPSPTNGHAAAPAPAGAGGLSLEELAALRDRVAEAARLQDELVSLSAAIDRTKRELSALHYEGPAAARFEAAGNELDAVVKATEGATESILEAAERIEQIAGNLSAAAKDDTERGQTDEIAEQVVSIFEACNFQDITGQRITKVVGALKFIEERVAGMMDIWGGANGLAAFAPEPEMPDETPETDESSLLNGPALEEADGHASQDDIDALFA